MADITSKKSFPALLRATTQRATNSVGEAVMVGERVGEAVMVGEKVGSRLPRLKAVGASVGADGAAE